MKKTSFTYRHPLLSGENGRARGKVVKISCGKMSDGGKKAQKDILELQAETDEMKKPENYEELAALVSALKAGIGLDAFKSFFSPLTPRWEELWAQYSKDGGEARKRFEERFEEWEKEMEKFEAQISAGYEKAVERLTGVTKGLPSVELPASLSWRLVHAQRRLRYVQEMSRRLGEIKFDIEDESQAFSEKPFTKSTKYLEDI